MNKALGRRLHAARIEAGIETQDDLTAPEQRRLLQEVIDYIVPVPGRHHLQESQIFWRC